jgi:hypothetical protein
VIDHVRAAIGLGEELVRERCELPGYTTLDAMTATIRADEPVWMP